MVYSSNASGGYNVNLGILNNGNTTIRGTVNSGAITTSGIINLNGDNLQFPNTLNQYKINLYGTNSYGFGIAGSTLMYSSPSYHKFYNGTTNTFTINGSGNIGILNTAPWAPLNVGDSSVASNGYINIAKNSGGNRNSRLGFDTSFNICLGDYGNANNTSNAWNPQLIMAYNAPYNCINVASNGVVTMVNGYTTSDERIKTNIKTIENALDKTLLLRGVEYNDFRFEPDKKHIGLIAQEVELIIPEVINVSVLDNIKSVSYGSLVGLLIEAIKEQQKQINDLRTAMLSKWP